MRCNVVIVTVLMFLLTQHGGAQCKESDNPVFISLMAYQGKFHVHTKELNQYNGTNPYGFELEVSQLLLGEDVKESIGTNVKWGIGINYVDFDFDNLGYSISTIGYLEPYFVTKSHFRFSIKGGAGVAYMSHPFDENYNPQNLTYSTRVAFPLFIGLSTYYFFNYRWAAKATASLQHISNGGIRKPNLGINYPVLSLGVEYALGKYSFSPQMPLNGYDKQKRHEFVFGYSLKEDAGNPDKMHIAVGMYNYSKQVSRINAITFTGMVEYLMANQNIDNSDQWSAAPLIGNEFLFGRLFFGQQIGVYVLSGESVSDILLQNYYLRYMIGSHLVAGAGLKAHGHIADFISVQVGWAF